MFGKFFVTDEVRRDSVEFTYNSYNRLIDLLRKNGYEVASYDNFMSKDQCVILRHDIDNSLSKAIKIAEIERNREVTSTYFLMITNEFYNVFSLNGSEQVEKIQDLGHEVGLHFDEYRYPSIVGNPDAIIDKIIEDAELLSHITGKSVTKVSMHRPSKKIIESNLQVPNMVNTYSNLFFSEFKYLSDSRRHWREPVESIIRYRQAKRLQILIHPFWYEEIETNIEDTLETFVNSANSERYEALNDNFTDLSEALPKYKVK